MTKPVAILCPESNVTEKTLRIVLSFFRSVKLCRPWFMDRPVPCVRGGAVQVLYPPDDLRPPTGFKRLLDEYRTWIRTSREKGMDAFLAFSEQTSHGEEASWEIRAELRPKEGEPEEERKRNAWKWNLLLHLAGEIQEEEKEAENLLRSIKAKDSPLKGVIEEQEGPGLLSDLPETQGTPFLSEVGMSQVLEAWFSLFAGHLGREEMLLTLNPAVFEYLSDTWEEWGEGMAEDGALGDAVVLRHFPLLKKSPVQSMARHLSGKTIGHIRDEQTYGK